ncbi:MAG: SEC-C metal-binding domain-containing protein [Candidatus Dormibacteria bacterium]
MSKRRRGFPSESRVKRGPRYVHGEKELLEQLGRNDPCPCGSGRRFQALLPEQRALLTASIASTICASDSGDALACPKSRPGFRRGQPSAAA